MKTTTVQAHGDEHTPGPNACPTCGTPTTPIRRHQTLCLDCTLDELGQSWGELKARTRTVERKAGKRMAGGRVDQVNLG